MAFTKNTGFKRATTATVTNFESGSILLAGEGIASSSTVGGEIILSGFPTNVPSGASIDGIQIQSKVLNLGSGSIGSESYANVSITAAVSNGTSFGNNEILNIASGSSSSLQDLNFGGSTDTHALSWTSITANNLQLKFTYTSDSNIGFGTSQSIAISGSEANLLPGVNIYYSLTPSSSYTRQDLRSRITASEDFDSGDEVTFTLDNNASTVAYFNIEGVNGKAIFNSASVYGLNNCTVVSESFHAGFIVNPNVTATFKFLPTHDILKNEIQFIAANAEYISGSTTSYYGVDLDITS